ncbi:MAG: cyclic nucleotide-binding domain-containing protein [Pseudorhodoplanes sp.]|nr:cyclic nucleotide-binding domain-containing protein [Pseudorhodoplanes sp.]
MMEAPNSDSLEQLLRSVSAFRDLSPEIMRGIAETLHLIPVPRGELLMRQGEDADALYLVVSGRFEVYLQGREDPLGEIGAGSSMGEIAFFSGGKRTASVKAERDSLVLRLDRADFDRVAAATPAIWRIVTATLARRLSEMTAGHPPRKDIKPRTIAICRAGPQPVPAEFIEQLRTTFEHGARAFFLDAGTFARAVGRDVSPDSAEATKWFNELETQFEFVVYVTDPELSEWSKKAVRQADLVLSVGRHAAGGPASRYEPSPIEQFAYALHGSDDLRLVLLHDSRGEIAGTKLWLDARPPVRMHHHVALGHQPDYDRLFRFINGTALGLVACGGGAFSAAHIGVYQALLDAGLEFDMLGGTSGGGAMTAAFALGFPTDEIDRRVDEIFVKGRVFRRWTWPRYSLIDHTLFDSSLEQHYTSKGIEDLWIPYFAVSTNLTDSGIYCHRSGAVWEAVRATGAIPVLLPPFYTKNGEMLVDGGLLDNTPVRVMRSLKNGPNVVISFQFSEPTHFHVDYRALPSRRQLFLRMLNPFSRRALPSAPGPFSVLMRSLLVGRHDFSSAIAEDDILLVLPMPPELSAMSWDHHSRLRADAYAFTAAELSWLKSKGHSLLGARQRPPTA